MFCKSGIKKSQIFRFFICIDLRNSKVCSWGNKFMGQNSSGFYHPKCYVYCALAHIYKDKCKHFFHICKHVCKLQVVCYSYLNPYKRKISKKKKHVLVWVFHEIWRTWWTRYSKYLYIALYIRYTAASSSILGEITPIGTFLVWFTK